MGAVGGATLLCAVRPGREMSPRTNGGEGTAPLLGAAVVPAAPLMLPEVSPGQPASIRGAVRSLRADARDAIGELPRSDVVVLLAASDRAPQAAATAGDAHAGPAGPAASGTVGDGQAAGHVHATAAASMKPIGTDLTFDLPVPADLASAVASALGFALDAHAPLSLDHAVLALQYAAGATGPVLPVAVPSDADGARLAAVGAGLVAVLRERALTATVVCCGDLATGLRPGGPGHVISGAPRWCARVVHAFAGGALDALFAMGPAEAARVGARGWAPLVALHGACGPAGLRPAGCTYRAPRGVGQLVARCIGASGGAHDPADPGRAEPSATGATERVVAPPPVGATETAPSDPAAPPAPRRTATP